MAEMLAAVWEKIRAPSNCLFPSVPLSPIVAPAGDCSSEAIRYFVTFFFSQDDGDWGMGNSIVRIAERCRLSVFLTNAAAWIREEYGLHDVRVVYYQKIDTKEWLPEAGVSG